MNKRKMAPAGRWNSASDDEGKPRSPRTDADRRIEASFRDGYVYKTYLADQPVTIHSLKGEVTLSGRVREGLHRTLAEEAILALPGVVRVENKLATEEEIAAESPDTWLGRKVMLALRLLRQLDTAQIGVEVKDGQVTLTGNVTAPEQKERISEYVLQVVGVRQVVNAMTMRSSKPLLLRIDPRIVDDASVTAQVKTALRVHRSTRNTIINVATHDGAVTLTGIARTDKEKALASVLVGDIRGVVSVNNEMNVESAATDNQRD